MEEFVCFNIELQQKHYFEFNIINLFQKKEWPRLYII